MPGSFLFSGVLLQDEIATTSLHSAASMPFKAGYGELRQPDQPKTAGNDASTSLDDHRDPLTTADAPLHQRILDQVRALGCAPGISTRKPEILRSMEADWQPGTLYQNGMSGPGFVSAVEQEAIWRRETQSD